MDNLTSSITNEMLCQGSDIVGIGDLAELPEDARCGFPIGICLP
jgi:hypothetical protein